MSEEVKSEEVKPVRLDLGAGRNKKGPDWIGVDSIAFEGVDVVCDLTARETIVNPGEDSSKIKFKPWPWEDNSVDEIHASHFIEHLDGPERVHFVNECYRILKMGSKAQITTPHWAAARAYGDLTHKWPPVSEFWFYYLDVNWRAVNAPHNVDYKCNFAATWGYFLRQDILAKNQEYQMFAMNNWKEVCQDTICTLTKTAFPEVKADKPVNT